PLALDALAQLQECSLVLSEETGGRMRFRMLETLREFGAESVPEEERGPLRTRHARYFLELAEAAAPHLTGFEQMAWVARLDEESDNLRAALGWLEVHDPAGGLRLAGSLARFWRDGGSLREGRQWLEALIRRSGSSDDRGRAVGLLWLGAF